jgi:type I restriction enzyme, S subunit
MREMKDSGVDWIGEIPDEWSIGRVKHAFNRKNEKAMQEDPIILSLARSGVRVRDVSNNDGQVAESYFNYNPVDIDDLLLNPMDLYSGANCSISKVAGVISPAYVNLKSKEGINPGFYDYYFKVQYWLMAFFAHGKGVSYENRWTLNAETLMNYPIVTLSYEEQCNRSDYLDEKCAKIDAIIARQQEVIEKLKAYKSSVTTEAVTKGLNSDVPMKDSGIEWIGEIPDHWRVMKLKYSTEILRGKFNHRPRNDPDYYDGQYPFVQTGDVARAEKYITNYSQTLNDLGYSVSKEFPKGSVVMSIAANVGDVAVLDFKACFPDSVVGFIPTEKVHWNYLFYTLKVMKSQLVRSAIISTQLNLNIERIKEEFIALPPLEEQKSIMDYLDTKCKRIDSAIVKKTITINKLTEYKRSLIYEVVTGKKEV